MAIADNDKKALIAELVTIIKKLQKEGLMKDNVDAEKTATAVIENLAKGNVDLKLDDVKNNPEKRNLLGLACIAEANPKNTLNYTELFKNDVTLSPELNKQLKLIFNALMEKKNIKDPAKQEAISEKVQELTDVIENRMRPEDQSDIARQLLISEILLQASIIADYGVDTRQPGAVVPVVQAAQRDYSGKQDLAPTGDSAKGQANNPNAHGEDYSGNKGRAAIVSLITAIIDTPTEINIVNELKESGLSLYKSPTNTPFGDN